MFEIIVEINNPLVYQTLANTTNTIAQGEVIQLMNIGNIDLDEIIKINDNEVGKIINNNQKGITPQFATK